MGCRRTLTHSASHFLRGNLLGPAGDVSLCLYAHPTIFNMHKHALVSYKHLLALRVLVTDISVPVKSLHLFQKTALLQRELKAYHNFPLTNCTLSKSTLIAEISTTIPAYPYQYYIWHKVLLLDPSLLFSFYLSGSQPFPFSYSFLL